MGKSKISKEKQIEIVKDYLSGKVGYKESVRRAGNSHSAIRRWIFQYKTGGEAAFSPQKKNSYYSPEKTICTLNLITRMNTRKRFPWRNRLPYRAKKGRWAKWQERAGNRGWLPCRPRPYMCMWRSISVFLWRIIKSGAVRWKTKSWC